MSANCNVRYSHFQVEIKYLNHLKHEKLSAKINSGSLTDFASLTVIFLTDVDEAHVHLQQIAVLRICL